jgi:hypothetical protein
MIRFLIGIPLFVVFISLAINVILALMLVLTYSSLTEEKVIAKINFEKLSAQDNVFIAHVYDDAGTKIGDFKIFGDQWRMDAEFIKMAYWANVFGIDSRYTLNRFEGRYKDITDENNNKHVSYQLESHGIMDKWSVFIDTTYGSSTYQDIKLKTKYTVLKSQTGLMVREKEIIDKEEKNYLEKAKEFVGYE